QPEKRELKLGGGPRGVPKLIANFEVADAVDAEGQGQPPLQGLERGVALQRALEVHHPVSETGQLLGAEKNRPASGPTTRLNLGADVQPVAVPVVRGLRVGASKDGQVQLVAVGAA